MTSEESVAPAELPPGRLPEDGTIHVWIFDVGAPWYRVLADAGVVSREELARAESFTQERLAQALLARRSALRFVLGRYLDRDPGSVRVVTAPGGKPVLLPRSGTGRPGEKAPEGGTRRTRADGPNDGPTLAFSVGHSGDLYGIAIATASSVGFDVERRRSIPRADAIARRWFGLSEARRLQGLDGAELEHEFMRLWTAKEALAKRHGAGLRLMMRGDTSALDTEAAERERRLRWLRPRGGYHAAVASTRVVEGVTVVEPADGEWI